jgi:hypothetical protein
MHHGTDFPTNIQKSSLPVGRNCGKHALQAVLIADAAGFSGFWAFFAAAIAERKV